MAKLKVRRIADGLRRLAKAHVERSIPLPKIPLAKVTTRRPDIPRQERIAIIQDLARRADEIVCSNTKSVFPKEKEKKS